MHLPVSLENLVNDRQKRLQLRRPRFRQPIAWRLRMLQHLLQSLPANVEFTTRSSLAHLAVQNATAYFNPQIHVCDHPVTCLIQNQTPGKTERLAEFQQMIIWALCNLAARHSPPSALRSHCRMHVCLQEGYFFVRLGRGPNRCLQYGQGKVLPEAFSACSRSLIRVGARSLVNPSNDLCPSARRNCFCRLVADAIIDQVLQCNAPFTGPRRTALISETARPGT